MKYDLEVIKDAIVEWDPSVKRENIVFENVYLIEGVQPVDSNSNRFWKDRIMAPFRFINKIGELAWSGNFSIAVDEYEARKRDKRISEIGI